MKSLVIFFLFFLVSCAGYVGNVHRAIDREDTRGLPKKATVQNRDYFANYRRQHPEKDKRPIKEPVTFSLNGSGPGQVRPTVKRDYRPQRHKASDFTDQEGDGSLWANQGSSSSLFTYQNDKHTGDMVIINVLESLRNQISSELKRTFPDKPKKEKPGDKKDAKAGDKAVAAAPATPAAKDEHEMEVYDKISGTVTEEISKDYILLRGHKEVIFKKEKRAIEVQALVSRKDIMENDYVNSDKLLESRVFILNREE
jgi:flagellar L-ring protein precursor FlgH